MYDVQLNKYINIADLILIIRSNIPDLLITDLGTNKDVTISILLECLKQCDISYLDIPILINLIKK